MYNTNVDEKDAIRLAELLAVPSYSDKKDGKFTTFERLNAIEKELDSSDCEFKVIVKDEKFWLCAQKDVEEIPGTLFVISSHADCKHRQKKPVFKDCGETIHGIFDNAITNAASLYLMTHCHMGENIVFAFTADEEKESRGAEALCQYLKKQGKDFKAIVLDVTNEAFDENADFTIENDFFYRKDLKWLEHIALRAGRTGFVWKVVRASRTQKTDNPKDYVELAEMEVEWYQSEDKILAMKDFILPGSAAMDETYKYDEFDISCFSFDLPCDPKDDMHSPDGFDIRKSNYFHYILGLKSILCASTFKEWEEIRELSEQLGERIGGHLDE